MPRLIHWILLLAAALAISTATPAQKLFHPEKFDRATKRDENGKLQWADHDGGKCPNCTGTGKHKCTICDRFKDDAKNCPGCARKEGLEAVCEACAGTGKFPDPLVETLCPGCLGSAFVLCDFCNGVGDALLGAGTKRASTCPSCRGDGCHVCTVCAGKRVVPTALLKPSLAEADLATLKKAEETTSQVLKDLQAWVPAGKKTRKEVKELQKIAKGGEKLFPPFKALQTHIDDSMKMVYGGSSYQGQVEREVNTMNRLKANIEYYLKVQKRILELAVKRAEENEKAG